jgi:ankyrin repeat protein
MIELLKTHLQNKDVDQAILLLADHPEVLYLKDDNKSSCFMIIAYSDLDEVFEKALELKEVFSFHEAIAAGKKDILNEYLEQSSPNLINTHSSDGFTPLSLAAFFNRVDLAKLLLENGADPNLQATNPSKVNALHAAVAKENVELCKLFLENGGDPDAVQMQHVTALHSAVHRGNLDLTKLLVEKGATIASKMDNGDTALLIATREGHAKIEAYLREKLKEL